MGEGGGDISSMNINDPEQKLMEFDAKSMVWRSYQVDDHPLGGVRTPPHTQKERRIQNPEFASALRDFLQL